MHNTICVIMHLFVTYQNLPLSSVSISGCSKIGPQRVRCVRSSLLTVHVAIPVRDADAKKSSSVKKTDETNIYIPLNKMDDYLYMVTF